MHNVTYFTTIHFHLSEGPFSDFSVYKADFRKTFQNMRKYEKRKESGKNMRSEKEKNVRRT
jgi:hypothetical protein